MSTFAEKLIPLTPSLGGSVSIEDAPKRVRGRDKLVESLWEKLETTGVSLLAERRMGKTWVLQLAMALRPGWAVPVFIDVENIHSPSEFTLRLNRSLHSTGLMRKPKWEWMRGLLQQWERMKGPSRRLAYRLFRLQIKGIDLSNIDPWFSLLETTLTKFVTIAKHQKIVIVLDELPFCVDNISKRLDNKAAGEFLDHLRSLRQTVPALRMLFSGSLGMHIVLKNLRETGYTGQPINDMFPFEVPALEGEEAALLAGSLLLGSKVECEDIEASARLIAKAGSYVPYYIEQLVELLRAAGESLIDPKQVTSLPARLFESPGDPGQFKHYNTRLDQYYPEDIILKARGILDVLSFYEQGLVPDELLNLIRHKPKLVTLDPESLIEVLDTLKDDHYLAKHDGKWAFKLNIVRQWWQSERGDLSR